MKVDVLNINEFINANNLEEVTNPIHFNMGNTPTSDGLFSYKIFGQPGSNDRKRKFAYISLKKPFLHPIMYRMITSMDKRVADIIYGTKYYRIERGDLIEDSENGETGLMFLYDNFDRIKFKLTESDKRSDKILLLSKLRRDEIFVTNFLVIPAYLRDYNPSKSNNGRITDIDVINELYAKLIRSAQSLEIGGEYNFLSSSNESTIQTLLVDIYNMLTSYLSKKTGLFHQSLLGKSVDYATRSVISAPRIKSKKWNENPIRFGSTGIPLSQICVLFYPFFIKYIQDFIDEHIDEISKFKDEKNNDVYIPNVKEQFSEDKIKKLIELYIKSVESRFVTITVEDEQGVSHPINIYKVDLGRNFTLTDLLYIAAVDICEGKHVYITRYPVEQYQNIYPSRVTIMSTHDTIEQKLEDRYLKNYPTVFPDYPCEEDFFIDTTVPYNGYLNSLGADYDGDTISLRAVYTVEANLEASKLITKKTNLLDQQGRNARSLGNEGIQSLFSLTRD